MAIEPKEKRSLLSSQARVQAPWIKVTIGNYTFGIFSSRENKKPVQDVNGTYSSYNIRYPNYIQRLNVVKVNGQINQYTLTIIYPVKPGDDPNFFEKVFSSVSNTRKIVFSYGDSAMPTYVYKDEEAIITDIGTQFNLEASSITYTVKAVSSAIVGKSGSFTFMSPGIPVKPSDIIKSVFKNPKYGLKDIFIGMNDSNINTLVEGGDKLVNIKTKTNISPLDYITYLVSCMIPDGSNTTTLSNDIYILTLHDDTVYDKLYSDTVALGGPYFKVTKTPSHIEKADAYEVDIGYNTATIVTNFQISKQENWSIFYEYNSELRPEEYVRRLNNKGNWESVYSPMFTSGNNDYLTKPEDITWFTKLTKYPIGATLTIQGLLRPAILMQYIRLNVVFPGGNKHISSGLYIITKQIDDISDQGYKTTLSLTRISN